MKKTLTVFTLIVTLMLTAVPAFAATDYKVTVDGSYVNFPDQAPIERDQRILTPIRFPMEAMGVTATWEQDTQQAVLTKGDTTAIFTLGETTYTVNGVNKTMDTAPIALNDRTLFPIRFAAEAFGATVTWQAPDTAVIKTTPTQGAGNWEEYASIYYLNDGDQGMIFHNETTDQISINMISHPEMNIEGKFILNEQFFSGTRTYWINDYPSGTKFEFEVTYQEVWKGPITGPFPGSWVKP